MAAALALILACAPGSDPLPPIDALDPWVQPAVWLEPPDPAPGEEVTVHYSGELAASGALWLRYGFNGWAAIEGPEQRPERSGEGWILYASEAAMEPVEGGFERSLTLPREARSLHMVFTDGRRWDDAEGLEYLWETQIGFPAIGPYLSWRGQTSSSMVVSWETGPSCLGVVTYGTGRLADRYAVGASRSRLHRIELDELLPDTAYTYQVHDCAGRSSPRFTFRTGPDRERPITFAVASDMQDNGLESQRWGEVARELAEHHREVELLLIPGDMPADDEPGFWWIFFDRGRALFAETPIVPVIGNHDTPGRASSPDASSFERYFATPELSGEPSVYALDYGPARFLALSSERPEELDEGGPQYEWLRATLASGRSGDRRAAPWVFAAMHHPPYDIGARHAASSLALRPITALLDGQVDWVFTAHEHLYQRFEPLRYGGLPAPSGRYGAGPDDGVGYIVTPSAGDKTWAAVIGEDEDAEGLRASLAWPPLGAAATADGPEHGFLTVAIDGDSLCIEAWGMGLYGDPAAPHVRDRVAYRRGP